MGSESDSLFGQLKSILDISDSAAGLTGEVRRWVRRRRRRV